jgi:hypothetical protein
MELANTNACRKTYLGEQKDKHIFNEVHKKISRSIIKEVYENELISTSIPERIDDLIYDKMELQISLIIYTSPWN